MARAARSKRFLSYDHGLAMKQALDGRSRFLESTRPREPQDISHSCDVSVVHTFTISRLKRGLMDSIGKRGSDRRAGVQSAEDED
jgi:hypothetical protein